MKINNSTAKSGEDNTARILSQYERLFKASLRNGQLDIAKDIVQKVYELLYKAMSHKYNSSEDKFRNNLHLFKLIIDTNSNFGALHIRLMQEAINHNANIIKELLIRLPSNILQSQILKKDIMDIYIDELILIHIFRINRMVIDARDFETFRSQIDVIAKSVVGDPSHIARDIEGRLSYHNYTNNKEIDEKGEKLRFMIKYECAKDFRQFDNFLVLLDEYEQLIKHDTPNQGQAESVHKAFDKIKDLTKELKVLSKFYFIFFQIGAYIVSKGIGYSHFLQELWYHVTPNEERITFVNRTPVTDDVTWLTLYAIYGGTGSPNWSDFFEIDFQSLTPYVLQYYCLLILRSNTLPQLPSDSDLCRWKEKENENYKVDFWFEFARNIPKGLLESIDVLRIEKKTQIIREQVSEESIANARKGLEYFLSKLDHLERELIKIKPLVKEKLEDCRRQIESAYAENTNTKRMAHVNFSQGKMSDYREILVERPLPRDHFIDVSDIFTEFPWRDIGSWVANEETKSLLSYLQENITFQSIEGSDFLTKIKNTIRLLKERGHHPNAMFIPLDWEHDLQKADYSIFISRDQKKMLIDGEEIYFVHSWKRLTFDEALIFSSQALEVKYASGEPPNPLSVNFKNIEDADDHVIVACIIVMKPSIKDSSAFVRFK